MDFLKFFKKGKEQKSADELDLPPPPPSLQGFDEHSDMPDFPDFEPDDSDSAGKASTSKKTTTGRPASFGFPDIPEMEEADLEPIPPISSAGMKLQPQSLDSGHYEHDDDETPDEEPQAPAARPMSTRPAVRLFSHERRAKEPSEKAVYVRVSDFKTMLGMINNVRSDMRKSDEAVSKLENMKMAKDKSMDKLKSSFEDLQKKLIFMDKTLFKGE